MQACQREDINANLSTDTKILKHLRNATAAQTYTAAETHYGLFSNSSCEDDQSLGLVVSDHGMYTSMPNNTSSQLTYTQHQLSLAEVGLNHMLASQETDRSSITTKNKNIPSHSIMAMSGSQEFNSTATEIGMFISGFFFTSSYLSQLLFKKNSNRYQ